MMKNSLSRCKTAAYLRLMSAMLGIAISLLGCSAGTDLTGKAATTSSPSTSGDGASLVFSLIDVATNADKNSISSSAATQLKAVLKDASGVPLSNQIVKFSQDVPGTLTFTPAASALTDAQGTAVVFASPSSLSVAGAYSVTAEALLSVGTLKSTRNYSIGTNNVAIDSLSASSTAISAYGTTTLTANVGGLATNASAKVQFSSTCGSNGRAILTSVADTVNGVATATYKDNACAGTDTVTATVQGTSASKSTTITASVPAIANIGFVSASPTTIVLKGTGSAGTSEVSIVKFRVYDQNGVAYTVPTAVSLNLSTFTGGLKLDNSTTAVSKPSNASGEVEVAVAAGTLPTPVTVKASIVDPVSGIVRTTESIKLSVSTGSPSQNFFSLSSEKLNIEGWDYDGVKTSVTVRAADRLANPVPDGTSVNLVAEGASIGSTCQTTAGACSVDFISQESRPRDGATSGSSSIGRTENGRITVLAYSIGEESFLDLNANNLYDLGEPYTDLGYLFIDNLETATFNAAKHQVIPFTNSPGTCVNPAVGLFSVPSVANTCDGRWGTAYVRRAHVIVLSGSGARLAAVDAGGGPVSYGIDSVDFNMSSPPAACTVSRSFYIQDVNGNPMAGGTKVEAAGSGDISKAEVGANLIADSTAKGGTLNFLTVTAVKTGGVCTGKGNVALRITSTRGLVTSFNFNVSFVP